MTHRAPSSVTAFLLCGGAGTRLRSVTQRPKTLLDVAGWPFIRYPIETIRRVAERIVFLTGHGAEEIEAAFGPGGEAGMSAFASIAGPKDPMRIFIREDAPLGTGGALAHARHWAGMLNWVANGDSFVDVDARAVIDAHRPGEATIVAVRLADASDYGALETDSDGRVRRFLEKGRGGPGIINAGVYLLDRALIDDLPAGPSSLEQDVFPRWADEGHLRAFLADALFRDIGTPERLAGARSEFARIRARMEMNRPG